MGAYNCESTVSDCIESIINQTYDDWEFIICDDCSNDNTYSVLIKWANIDDRIRIIRNEKNMKLAASLNNCLAVAKGEYIARMDADDRSCPERLQKQVYYLDTHPNCDVVGTNRIIIADGALLGIRKSPEYPDKKILLRTTPFAHPTIMMRKSVYKELGGYTESKETMRAEDADLWFRFYSRNHNGYNIQEALYEYSESENDYKKRNLHAAILTSKVYLKGYRLLKFPLYSYCFILKPIIAAIAPNRLMYLYHKKKLKKDQ